MSKPTHDSKQNNVAPNENINSGNISKLSLAQDIDKPPLEVPVVVASSNTPSSSPAPNKSFNPTPLNDSASKFAQRMHE